MAYLRVEEHHPPHRPVERARLPEPLLGQSDTRERGRAERAARLVHDRAQVVEGGDVNFYRCGFDGVLAS